MVHSIAVDWQIEFLFYFLPFYQLFISEIFLKSGSNHNGSTKTIQSFSNIYFRLEVGRASPLSPPRQVVATLDSLPAQAQAQALAPAPAPAPALSPAQAQAQALALAPWYLEQLLEAEDLPVALEASTNPAMEAPGASTNLPTAVLGASTVPTTAALRASTDHPTVEQECNMKPLTVAPDNKACTPEDKGKSSRRGPRKPGSSRPRVDLSRKKARGWKEQTNRPPTHQA